MTMLQLIGTMKSSPDAAGLNLQPLILQARSPGS
jgi:hypothetical protein